jgi:hypothetical protein
MVTVLMISRHTPADCSFHNEKSAKILADYFSKHAELAAKHGVKEVGGWNVSPEHLVVQVLEAPTFEALQAYSMEPEVMAMSTWNTMEFKVAITLEEVGRMMQQMMQSK